MMRPSRPCSTSWVIIGALVIAFVLSGVGPAGSQNPQPTKIGFGTALTGGLASA